MFLADLLGAPVRQAGQLLGYVADVRLFVPEHTPGQQVGTPEVFGLVVCPRRAGSFLGYERTDVNAPALLARFFEWRSRGSFLVVWQDIAQCGDLGVDLLPGAEMWSTALPRQ